MTTIYTTTTAPLATHEHDRVITATFRQPARSVHVIIDWSLVSDSLADVPSQYRPLVEAVMLTAAKDILSDYIKGYSVGVAPAEVDAGMFSYPAILDRATNVQGRDHGAVESECNLSSMDHRQPVQDHAEVCQGC